MERERYRFVCIPKRSGGTRVLEIPDSALMAEQRDILGWLYARRLAPSPYAHGFVRGRSISTNARAHVGKKVVIRLDVADFFPSTTAEMVRQALYENRVPREALRDLVDKCTLENRLPQGAPTSPFLANLVAARLDIRLAGLARTWTGGAYSRYADDLCFSSSDSRFNQLIPPAKRIIEEVGYRLNPRKIRVYRQGARQVVAGVVVNQKPNPSRAMRRNLRAAIHESRLALLAGNPTGSIQRLRGLAAHVYSINREAGARFLRDVEELENMARVAAGGSS
jgi:RNA-directed DNA polymerase